jgi:hypothetical protein
MVQKASKWTNIFLVLYKMVQKLSKWSIIVHIGPKGYKMSQMYFIVLCPICPIFHLLTDILGFKTNQKKQGRLNKAKIRFMTGLMGWPYDSFDCLE